MNTSHEAAEHLPAEEISFTDIIKFLWEGKAALASFTLGALAVAVAILALVRLPASGSLELRPIGAADIDKYAELNAVLFPPLSATSSVQARLAAAEAGAIAEKAPVPYFPISADKLVELLGQDLSQRATIVQALKNSESAAVDPSNGAGNSETEVLKESYDFKFLPPSSPEELQNPRSKNVRQLWTIQYEGKLSEEVVAKVLQSALDESNSNVREFLKSRFARQKAITLRDQKYALQDIDLAISNAIADYKLKTASQLEYLKEQAQIARALGIAKNTIEAQSFGRSGSAVVATIGQDDNAPGYLRGYEALEKEIGLIEGRTDINDFIPQLAELQAQRRLSEQEQLVQRAQVGFDSSPLAHGQFVAASYDIADFELRSKVPKAVVLLGAVIAGLALGISFLVVRNTVQKL